MRSQKINSRIETLKHEMISLTIIAACMRLMEKRNNSGTTAMVDAGWHQTNFPLARSRAPNMQKSHLNDVLILHL